MEQLQALGGPTDPPSLALVFFEFLFTMCSFSVMAGATDSKETSLDYGSYGSCSYHVATGVLAWLVSLARGGFALGVKTGNLPEPAMGEMRAAKLELVIVWLCVFSTYTAAVSVSTVWGTLDHEYSFTEGGITFTENMCTASSKSKKCATRHRATFFARFPP